MSVPGADYERNDRNKTTLRGWTSKLVGFLIPESVRIRAVSLSLRVPKQVVQDQPMEFQVVLRNWLPVPLSIPTSGRPWYWELDGVHDADAAEPDPTDPDGIISDSSGELSFSPFETKQITRVWNGRLRTDSQDPFLPLEPGEHVLEAEVTTRGKSRPQASQTFLVVESEADEE